MAMENVVIAYKADINDVKRQVTTLQRLNTIMAKHLGAEFTKGATVVRRELTKISQSVKPIKLASGKETNEMRTFTTVLRGANGQLSTVKQTTAGAGKNLKVLNTTVSKGATIARTFGQNLGTLLKRAALTIPVWFALRNGVGAVFRTIKEGLKAIVDFDRALQKAKRNLQGTAEEIERNFGILRKEVTKLSIETGKSVEDITNAFQKFATVGFDFETSLAGANSATKLSILLFGDAEETATAFARSMRVLIDESKDAKPAGEQLAEVMALTSELWKTNAFELNELTASLTRFAPVAKTAGFSAGEAVKLMAGLSTAGLRGSKAGRLLSTSLTRLLTKTDELAKSLGVKVNPEVDRTYDVFLRVLDALQKTRSETGKVSPEFEKLTKSIFGLRSGLAVKGLIALRSNLQDVLGVTGDIGKFNKEFEEVNKTVFQLVAQFHNLNREIGKAFVIGLVGGEDFRDTLEKIVELQEKIQKGSRILGKVFVANLKLMAGNTQSLVSALEDTDIDALKYLVLGTKDAKNKLKEINNEILKNNEKLLKGLSGQLDRANLERLIFEIETEIKLDTKQFDVDKSTLIKAKKELEKQFGDLEPIEVDVQLKIGKQLLTTEQQNQLIEDLIKDQLKRLKIDGATESQILKIEDALRKQHDVGYDIVAQKQQQLKIEREITKEQQDRIKFSDESAKLAEIAKTEGIQTAVAIGEVLNNQRDFNTFLRQGGKRAEILKSTFEDFVKNKELEQFFKGEVVLSQPGLRGGERIPIQELERRDFTAIRAKADFALAKARLGLEEVTNTNINALQSNTSSLASLIDAYNRGVTLYGDSSQRIVEAITKIEIAQAVPRLIANLPVGQVTTAGFTIPKQVIDLNIDISGQNLELSGTREEIINIVKTSLSPKLMPIIERALAYKLENDPQAPITKASDSRAYQR